MNQVDLHALDNQTPDMGNTFKGLKLHIIIIITSEIPGIFSTGNEHSFTEYAWFI